MALSPEYGWPEPDNSSLVKNGAQDIRALGDAIDTSVWNVGYGQAGKNRLINGDFGINQRQFTSVTATGFTFDRFQAAITNGGGTVTVTPQVFTPGTAPVAGYEATNFIRIVTASQSGTDSRAALDQNIEDVRTFAGQTITVSFYAKAGSGTPNINATAVQVFGSGGSASVFTVPTKKAITTSWARYSFTFAVPSISGKTIGAGSFLRIRIWMSAGSDNNSASDTLGIQNNTFDIWGVQAEYGSKETPFQTATGTIQGELAACQRYYFRANWAGETGYGIFGSGSAYSTTQAACTVAFPVPMRVRPTAIDYPTPATYFDCIDTAGNGGTISTLSFDANQTLTTNGFLSVTNGAANLTAYRPVNIRGRNSTDAYIGWTAEL
jgi:hypothetical protein